MKKVMMRALLSVLLLLSLCAGRSEAADIWVDHWASEKVDVDVYVMEGTLQASASGTGRHFRVSTKEVQDGEVRKIVHWTFSQYESEMWRYETSTMDGSHTTVVTPRNALFEFCMEELGWPYRIEDFWYF